jgi:hypothetical protein
MISIGEGLLEFCLSVEFVEIGYFTASLRKLLARLLVCFSFGS